MVQGPHRDLALCTQGRAKCSSLALQLTCSASPRGGQAAHSRQHEGPDRRQVSPPTPTLWDRGPNGAPPGVLLASETRAAQPCWRSNSGGNSWETCRGHAAFPPTFYPNEADILTSLIHFSVGSDYKRERGMWLAVCVPQWAGGATGCCSPLGQPGDTTKSSPRAPGMATCLGLPNMSGMPHSHHRDLGGQRPLCSKTPTSSPSEAEDTCLCRALQEGMCPGAPAELSLL